MKGILGTKSDCVFVLGNGFDIDLGLPTSYRSFAESSYWPFSEPDSYCEKPDSFNSEPRSLHNMLYEASLDSSWFDIERLLSQYATYDGTFKPNNLLSSREYKQAVKDELTYNLLVSSLTAYLKSLENHPLNKESVAALVLKSILKNEYFKIIFSFNYTDLRMIAQRLGIENKFWFSHMHGSLNDGIIVGFESQVDFAPVYRFMCKEYNMNYQTRYLNFYMQEAKEIVIFGHSLGEIDYHYFEMFFSNQSKESLTYPESKRITIFTKNKESKMDICDQLRKMNSKRLDFLFGNNILQIIRTDGSDSTLIEKFMEHINYKGAEYKRIHTRN